MPNRLSPARGLTAAGRSIAILALTLVLVGCDVEPPLRLHSLAYQQIDVKALQGSIAGVRDVEIVSGDPGAAGDPVAALLDNHADLTIVENSRPFTAGVRTVIPLYRSVLHLLVRDDLDLDVLRQSADPVSVYVVNDSHAGRTFVKLVSERAGLQPGSVQLVDALQPGVTDAIVYFGPINPQSTNWYRPGYHLASLDVAGSAIAGFLRDGVSLLVPQLSAMEIPALTYPLPGNEGALQSLSVSTLLVARAQASESSIYYLTRALLQEKARFAALEPDIFSWVSERFDHELLNFPLHAGARRYLERDEPGLLERYAETLNFLVYLAILLATGVVGMVRWRRQRRKDRVDTFYSRVLTVRERAHHEEAGVLLDELLQLEREAYQLLISEQLAADESFRIFTDLLATVRGELQRNAPHAV